MKSYLRSLLTALLVPCLLPAVASAAAKSADTRPIKILAIGNSFSEDAVEQYLHELIRETGREAIVANLYIGGASVQQHVENSTGVRDHEYDYRKIDTSGRMSRTENVLMTYGLEDEDWDFISIQQVSVLSGNYDKTMEHLPELIAYVAARIKPGAKLMWHQTWAYQQDSTHWGFANYNHSQEKMYAGIIDATKRISQLKGVDFIIPAGTAIQNARSSSLGDTLTRDGYHLELNYGRFTAACTWYQKILGLDVRKNSYVPESVTPEQARIAKEAAYKAVRRPFKVSKIKG